MAENRFHRSHSKQVATWFALLAIALIIVAPLISVSLQKSPMSMMPGMMHHDMPMTDNHHLDPVLVQMPVDHAEACGYCVLFAHVPGLILALALLIYALLLRFRKRPALPVIQVWHFFPWLYPDTRAPPRWSAFSC